MYFTHHFAHTETLSRVKDWLTRLGLEHRSCGAHDVGIPRLVLATEPRRLDAVRMLISAVERKDPDGCPSFWQMARVPYAAVKQEVAAAPPPGPPNGTLAIGWHPID